jgi:hypothetical protein
VRRASTRPRRKNQGLHEAAAYVRRAEPDVLQHLAAGVHGEPRLAQFRTGNCLLSWAFWRHVGVGSYGADSIKRIH